MCNDGAELLNQTEGEVAVRRADRLQHRIRANHGAGQSFPPPCPVRRRTLPTVLEDRGRMVSVNSKVILTLTPEGHALSYFPGVQQQLSDGIRDAV